MRPELWNLYQEISEVAKQSPIDALILKWERIKVVLVEAAGKMTLAPAYCRYQCPQDCPVWKLLQCRCCQEATIIQEAYRDFLDKVNIHLWKLRQKKEQLANNLCDQVSG